MTFTRLARWGIVVIALHNLEEALTMPHWLAPRLAALEARFGIRPLAEDSDRFYAGLVVATLVPALWIAVAARAEPPHHRQLLPRPCLRSVLRERPGASHHWRPPARRLHSRHRDREGLVIPFSICLAVRHPRYATAGGLAVAVFATFALYLPLLSILLGMWR
ncbi:MAG TPA: hypothetical protein VES67_08325 [Vicinamibacterales bacterium]|nr:hypothetical protein [Vicinamibacterales bacterium]